MDLQRVFLSVLRPQAENDVPCRTYINAIRKSTTNDAAFRTKMDWKRPWKQWNTSTWEEPSSQIEDTKICNLSPKSKSEQHHQKWIPARKKHPVPLFIAAANGRGVSFRSSYLVTTISTSQMEIAPHPWCKRVGMGTFMSRRFLLIMAQMFQHVTAQATRRYTWQLRSGA